MRRNRSANKSPHVGSRGRDYLRPDEANALIEVASKVGRQPLRDQCLLRLIYRHGLRASEARDARRTDFDLTAGSGPKTFHVRRLKGSVDSVHTLDRDEVSALRKLRANSTSPFVFVSERGGPLSPDMIAPHCGEGRRGCEAGVPCPSPYAAACHGLRSRQRGDGHSFDPGLPWPCLDRQRGALHEAGARAFGGGTGEVGWDHSQHQHELNSARLQPGRRDRSVRHASCERSWERITRSEIGRPNARNPSWGSRNARPRTEVRFRGGC